MIACFSVDPVTFREAVTWVARWIPAKPTEPHWAYMSLESVDGALHVVGLGQDVFARATIGIVDGGNATVAVSGRLLASVMPTLPTSGPALLRIEERHVAIEAGPVTVTLPVVGHAQLGTKLQVPPIVATIPGADLAHAVERVAPVAARDDYAGALRAVRLDVLKEFPLRLVASDTRRAAETTISVEPAVDTEILVPADILAEVTRTLRVVDIGSDGHLASFHNHSHEVVDKQGSIRSTPDLTLVVRQISEKYPIVQINRALEYKPPTYVIVPLIEFRSAVKRAILLRTDKQPLILDWTANELTVSLNGMEGSAAEVLRVDYSGADTRLAVNPVYLSDALSAIDGVVGDHVLIGFDPDRPTRPVVVVGVDDESYRHVLVPIDLDRNPYGGWPSAGH